MININRFLQTSHRSDLIGFNLGSAGIADFNKVRCETGSAGATHGTLWDPPAPGMRGVMMIGHHTNVRDGLTVSFTADGRQASLHPTRNLWTPAWMDTTFRRCKRSGWNSLPGIPNSTSFTEITILP